MRGHDDSVGLRRQFHYTCRMSESEPKGKLRPGPAPWQRRWYEIIFEADTPAGKAFDVALLLVILGSVAVVMLESVSDDKLAAIHPQLKTWLRRTEWAVTLLFSVEFIARMACVVNPARYVGSFFGIVDLLALLPTYLSLLFQGTGTQVLATIRTLRLLRVFRVFKMGQHVAEANQLLTALRRTWPKITVFLSVIFCAIVILGTVMYLIERGAGSGFDSIPVSVYWAIVTMTTVGYGSIEPTTVLGQTLASVIMLFGYAIIIVPTGIFQCSGDHTEWPTEKVAGLPQLRARRPRCGCEILQPVWIRTYELTALSWLIRRQATSCGRTLDPPRLDGSKAPSILFRPA